MVRDTLPRGAARLQLRRLDELAEALQGRRGAPGELERAIGRVLEPAWQGWGRP